MSKLPARGMKKANVQSGGPLPAAPRRIATITRAKMAPVGTKLAPKMLNSTTPAHTNRTRAVQVAQGAPGIANLGTASLGYPTA